MLYRVFADFANTIYDVAKTNESQLFSLNQWEISLQNYGFQNEAEWLANMFRDYLYTNYYNWAYINYNIPELKSFFSYIWRDGNSFSFCQATYNVPMVDFAQVIPINNLPTVEGFTQAESEAIWNVCFQTENKANYTDSFNQLLSRLTSNSYPTPAQYYKLGYGDCSHDCVIDWVCTYRGPASAGGNYLWNNNNKTGAYTFVVSGKSGDGFADYRQDPYDTDLGTLLQPMYREWQGTYGSCNGTLSFDVVPDRFPIYSQNVSNMTPDLADKTVW